MLDFQAATPGLQQQKRVLSTWYCWVLMTSQVPGALAGWTLVKLVHWVEKGHVFCPFERQLCIRVIVYHFRDAVKHSARLVQCVFVVFCLSHYDVDAPLTSLQCNGISAVP